MCHTPPMRPTLRFLLPALGLMTTASPVVADGLDAVDALANRPAVRAALQHLVAMERELLDDLVELTEIPAPRRTARGRAASASP